MKLLLVLLASLVVLHAAVKNPEHPNRFKTDLSDRLEEIALHQELYAQMWPQRADYFQGRADGIRLAMAQLEP